MEARKGRDTQWLDARQPARKGTHKRLFASQDSHPWLEPIAPSDKSSARLRAKTQAIKGMHLAMPHKKYCPQLEDTHCMKEQVELYKM